MIREGDLVAVFHSIHRVLKAEKILQEAGLPFRLIPAPRQLGADCGLAISFAQGLRPEIEASLATAGLAIAELWLLQSGTYRKAD